MVRPYGFKVRKPSKRRKLEEDEQPTRAEAAEVEVDGSGGGTETEVAHPTQEKNEDERRAEDVAEELAGLPAIRSLQGPKPPGVIFVLERATLEIGKVGKDYQLLSSDKHANFLRKHNRNPADYRPDIVHQALLTILDSPITKAGRLQALYVKTEKGVLFEVKPYVRMPRTPDRFAGLMLQLLQKLSITASGKREKLLNVIKNPVTRYLPVNSRKIGLSYSSEKLVSISDFVAAASDDTTLVFVVGAMAHGQITKEYSDEFISISNYPLSAACCLSQICYSLQQKWKIL